VVNVFHPGFWGEIRLSAGRTGIQALRLVLSLLLVAPGGAVQAQRISGPPDCSSCRIEYSHVLRLTGVDSLGGVSSAATLRRTAGGRFVLSNWRAPGTLQVFSAAGRLETTVGTFGSGPGEHRQITGLYSGGEGRIYVTDWGNTRLAVYGRDLTLETTIPLPFRADGIADIGDGRVLVAANSNQAEFAGLPLHVLDSEGRVRRSFGSDQPV
jgi:hypothetical protein